MIIYFHNAKKEYFSKLVFSGIRMKLNIEASQKIGIVGKNGEGKTTLLKMISGIDPPDVGLIKIEPKRSKIFYISVDNINIFNGTTEEFLFSLDIYLLKLSNQIKDLSENLDDDSKLEEYGKIGDIYEKSGGYTWEEKISKILENLKLSNKYVSNLSGGEKSRLILASIKIVTADLILMDEPTNHLDIEALKELEEFVKNDKRSYLIVSHDQKFLDNTVSKIINIDDTKIKLFEGNYSAYKNQKDLEEKQLMEDYLKNQREKKRLEDLSTNIVDRNKKGMIIAAPKSGMVKGKRLTNTQGIRLKISRDNDKMAVGGVNQKMESLMHNAKIIRNRIDRLPNLAKPKKDWGIKLDLIKENLSSDFVIKTKDVSFKYDKEGNTFYFPNLTVSKNEKVAIIGPNGIGKSTFIKIIIGLVKNYNGEVLIPESVKVGYYSQTNENINLNRSVLLNLLDLDTIEDYNTPAIKEARNFLHQMLFTGDNVLQKAGDLSQGEQSKLSLAKIIYCKPNLLVLDEPTNHLDIPSKERLEDALTDYTGAMLVVSHDRYFMESIKISKYFELK